MSKSEDRQNDTARLITGNHGPLTPLERFMGWLAGLDANLLKIPRWDRIYVGSLAFSLFFPAVLGGIGMYYTLGNFADVDTSWVTGAAVFWAVVIFAIDRQLLMASLRGSGLLGMAVRVFLALLTSLVTSTTIEVKLFEGRLENARSELEWANEEALRVQGKSEHTSNNDPIAAELRARESALVSEITSLRSREEDLIEHQNKLEGEVSDEIRNVRCGVKCEDLKVVAQSHRETLLEPHQAKLATHEQDLKQVRGDLNSRVSLVSSGAIASVDQRVTKLHERQNRTRSDIITKIEQLHEIARESDIIFVMMWIIRLLLISVELTPLLAKVLTRSVVEARVKEQLQLFVYREEMRAGIDREVLDRVHRGSVVVESGKAELSEMLQEINELMASPLWYSDVLDSDEVSLMQAQVKEFLKRWKGTMLRVNSPFRAE